MVVLRGRRSFTGQSLGYGVAAALSVPPAQEMQDGRRIPSTFLRIKSLHTITPYRSTAT